MGTLRIPGLTACPEPVHQFQTMMEAVINNTKTILQTKNDISLLTGAGTRG